MNNKSDVQKGWEFAANIMGADLSDNLGSDYVDAVEKAIKQLEESINNHKNRNLPIDRLQGFMFEEWASGTFNIDAVAADSGYKTEVLHSTGKDSVDIALKHGNEQIDTYSAKSYKTPEKSAIAQARLDTDTRQASYKGQERLIPKGQLERAKAEAHRRGITDVRPEVSEAYLETEKNLTETISADDGTSSKEVSRKELDKIAKESKKQKFNAEKHGITTKGSIKTEYLAKQAIKAGYSAAAVTIVMQLAPEIYKAIDYLIKNGEIDIQQIKKSGLNAMSSGAESFLRGSIASALQIMCDSGMLGNAFKGINPSVLGTVVALVMQTVKNSILVAAGKMSPRQMGSAFVDTIVVSGGYLAGAHLGGLIGQALGFELPVIGYLLGSLIGTSFCVVYNIGKKQLISFCADTGFTCFGLVEQDYVIPEDVLNEIGVETIPIPRTKIETTEVPRTDITKTKVNTTEYETIDITVLRRGIIGVNKIGYVVS